MKDSNKEGNKLWTTVGSHERNCDGTKEDNSDGITEYSLVGTFYDATFVLCDITTLGVTNPYKLGEEFDFKGVASLGVSKLCIVGIPEGTMFADSSKLGE